MLKNRYKIKYMFDQGGMSKIFKAHDLFMDEIVAVKEICIPEDEKEYEAELRKRLQREYRLLSSLQHDNVIRAIDFFEENDSLFLVLEFVDGEPLDKILSFEKDVFSLKDKVSIALSVAKAIETINDTGIVHRDVKPSNIVLDKTTGRPKVLDLGIGKPLQADNFTQLTVEGNVLGTVDYMSPEQLHGETDTKTDVFSLGITLHQFFTWQEASPFFHSDTMTTAQKIITEQVPLIVTLINPKELEKHREEYQALSAMISCMLMKNSLLRIPMSKVIEILDNVDQKLQRNY